MNLYEITTGYTGESYVRAYAWAADEVEAETLFWDTNPDAPVCPDGLKVELILEEDNQPFCTKLSDCGWGR